MEQLCFVMSRKVRRLGSGQNERRKEEEINRRKRGELFLLFLYVFVVLALSNKIYSFNVSRYTSMTYIHSSSSCFIPLENILCLFAKASCL